MKFRRYRRIYHNAQCKLGYHSCLEFAHYNYVRNFISNVNLIDKRGNINCNTASFYNPSFMNARLHLSQNYRLGKPTWMVKK